MIERADINSVLAQMRSLRSEMQQTSGSMELPSLRPEGMSPSRVNESGKGTFTELLKSAVDTVSGHHAFEKRMREAYHRGDPSVDLPQVMIQAQTPSVSFEAMTMRMRSVQIGDWLLSW